MNRTRLTKIEQHLRSRPCPGCGRTFEPPEGISEPADLARLSADEQHELAVLIAAAMLPACARCGRSDHDIGRMTDDQKERALALIRVLFVDSPLARLGAPDGS